jgi:hypothetical protein
MRGRQLQFFSMAEVNSMRDRTKSRHYSSERDEFRRDHARRRAWGKARYHAMRLRLLYGEQDCQPLSNGQDPASRARGAPVGVSTLVEPRQTEPRDAPAVTAPPADDHSESPVQAVATESSSDPDDRRPSPPRGPELRWGRAARRCQAVYGAKPTIPTGRHKGSGSGRRLINSIVGLSPQWRGCSTLSNRDCPVRRGRAPPI